MPAIQQAQLGPAGLGQQPVNNAYFSSVVVDPTAAFQSIDPVNINQTLIGYPTAAAPPQAIVNQQPSHMMQPCDANPPRVEIPEQLFLNLPQIVPFEAAAPPAPDYGAYEGYSPDGFVNKATPFS
ncbi:hypothetical protein AnigIFM49718_003766 [Aspergillus niger]|nr:hypothetical protein AnigIFM49718_003766 [Aspergillus niger]